MNNIISLTDIIPGHKMCCVCFNFIPYDELYIDDKGQKWDNCIPCTPLVLGVEHG